MDTGNGKVDVRTGDDAKFGANIWLSVDGLNWFSVYKPQEMMMFATLMRGRMPSTKIPLFHLKCEPDPVGHPTSAFDVALRVGMEQIRPRGTK